jgi:hypothetical protein
MVLLFCSVAGALAIGILDSYLWDFNNWEFIL